MYDAKLAADCQALGVAHSLGELPAGIDHEVEKVRIEAALEKRDSGSSRPSLSACWRMVW